MEEEEPKVAQNPEDFGEDIGDTIFKIAPPVVDRTKINAEAQKLAEKAFMDVLKDYYTGYNSPYKEAIKAELEKMVPSHKFELPEITGMINAALETEMDRLVNTAIAHSYLPMITKKFTKVGKRVDFSEILIQFVEASKTEDPSSFDCDVKNDKSSVSESTWKTVRIQSDTEDITFRIWEYHGDRDNPDKSGYRISSMPYESVVYDEFEPTITAAEERMEKRWGTGRGSEMEITKVDAEGGKVSIKMPLTQRTLDNEFRTFLASVLLADARIQLDETNFTPDIIQSDYRFENYVDEDHY